MGNANTVLDDAAARHLLRRTGFGALPKEVVKFVGLTRGEAADTLVGFRPKSFKPNSSDIARARAKWIKFMLKSRAPLQEKLVLFWHDHFATGYSKVESVRLMANQNKTLRLGCKGDMRLLVKAINKDAAMIEWLDTVRNRKFAVNENYARELQELFTLGVQDLRGNPTYTETDIKQIARAFSGWYYDDDTGLSYFRDEQHDYMAQFPSRGNKSLFGQTVSYTPNGKLGGFAAAQSFANPEGATEIDQLTDIIFQHTDSDGENTVARRTTQRLLEFFCHGGWATPDNGQIQIIDDLISASGFDVAFDVGALLRELFVNDVFFETQPAPFASPTPPKSIKWPIDFLITTLRLTGVKPKGSDQILEGGDFLSLSDHLSTMGQDLFEPPSVFGWDWELAWISSATLLARYGFARDAMAVREGGGRFKPEKLLNPLTAAMPAPDVVDAVLAILGVDDQYSTAERDALVTYLGGPSATLDLLNDIDLRNMKLGGLFALILGGPVYQTH
jgi:uncharacterized protein (DUF1800 family)